MKKISFFLLLLLLCGVESGQLMAQTKVVTGTIVSGDDRQTLPGVNVSIKGTTTGVVTDINGRYSIQANSKDILVFSFIGYKTAEIAVGDQTEINTTLVLGSVALDEVVVVGYGNKKKSDLIGSVSSVKAAELVGTPTSDLRGMLKGQVAGLNVSVNGVILILRIAGVLSDHYKLLGHIETGYYIMFIISGMAYLTAWLVMHMLAPGMKQVKL